MDIGLGMEPHLKGIARIASQAGKPRALRKSNKLIIAEMEENANG